MYVALIDVGTKSGLVERTLNIAYNMECEGFTLSSRQVLALIEKARSDTEASYLLQTFELLHSGKVHHQDESTRVAPFESQVYVELIRLLTRFAKPESVEKVKKFAKAAGYEACL